MIDIHSIVFTCLWVNYFFGLGISSPLACYARNAGKPLVTCKGCVIITIYELCMFDPICILLYTIGCSRLLHLSTTGDLVTTEGLKIKKLQVYFASSPHLYAFN